MNNTILIGKKNRKVVFIIRLLKLVAAMINRLAAYQLAMVRHCVKTAFIAGVLFVINPDLQHNPWSD